MKKYLVFLLVGLLLLCQWGGQIAAEGPAPVSVAGTWVGVLSVSGIQLHIVFNITANADGSLTSTMDSPDQGAKGIPVGQTSFQDMKLHLDMPLIKGSYDGTMNEAGTEITGEWKQGQSFPLNMKRTTELPKVNRPQDPKPPFPYNEEEVTYTNKTAGITLAGTLTTPKEKGPFPAVILITGSGAQDRNETILNHHPFWVIADYLTRRGIAVLRVDDRGVGGSTGGDIEATSADFAVDVQAGINFLKARKDINAKQIGLIGHSEGGMIAPMVAAQSKDVAFIVLLAGPGLKGDEILRKQSELLIRANGGSDQDVAKQMKFYDSVFPIVENKTDPGVMKTKLHDLALKLFNEASDEDKKALNNDPANLEAQLQAIALPWYRYFLTYDPVPALQKVTCPVLALNGSKDLQVPPVEDLAAIAAALKAGKNKDYTTKELPELNHLFQHCTTGSSTEYGNIEETFAPEALQIMGDWIAAHTGKKK